MTLPRQICIIAVVALLLSGAAVTVVVGRGPGSLVKLAEAFASPGELLWWSTLGGAFAGYPSGALGYSVWFLGTALFWFVVTALLLAVARTLRFRNGRGSQ